MCLLYVSYVSYISIHIICICINVYKLRSRDIFFISSIQFNEFSTQVLLLLQSYSSCVVAFGEARYIARRGWLKRWVVVLVMVQKSYTTWDVKKNLVNSGINYLSTGAGFLPSTVWMKGGVILITLQGTNSN